jgi:lysophospholipase L1-like esterase
MPGQKLWAPTVDDIDPTSCMGYSNVVLLCGINDIRQPEISSESEVIGVYQKLKMKIKQIKSLSPQTFVYICRLLPTKDNVLNQKVVTFNRAIYSDMLKTCKGVTCVDGFVKFADRNHCLAPELSKSLDRSGRPDMLHLNSSGVRILASLIKQSLFYRINGGVDRRRHTNRVNGRLYSDTVRGPPAPRRR